LKKWEENVKVLIKEWGTVQFKMNGVADLTVYKPIVSLDLLNQGTLFPIISPAVIIIHVNFIADSGLMVQSECAIKKREMRSRLSIYQRKFISQSRIDSVKLVKQTANGHFWCPG